VPADRAVCVGRLHLAHQRHEVRAGAARVARGRHGQSFLLPLVVELVAARCGVDLARHRLGIGARAVLAEAFFTTRTPLGDGLRRHRRLELLQCPRMGGVGVGDALAQPRDLGFEQRADRRRLQRAAAVAGEYDHVLVNRTAADLAEHARRGEQGAGAPVDGHAAAEVAARGRVGEGVVAGDEVGVEVQQLMRTAHHPI
jgi:hypothetical protein